MKTYLMKLSDNEHLRLTEERKETGRSIAYLIRNGFLAKNLLAVLPAEAKNKKVIAADLPVIPVEVKKEIGKNRAYSNLNKF